MTEWGELSFKVVRLEMAADRRLDREEATKHLRTFIKSCMDYKVQLTNGHNLGIDIIENETAAACLTQAAKMLDYDASHLYEPW